MSQLTQEMALRDIVNKFSGDANVAGLRVEDQMVRRFFSSLLTKRFLICTGLAGSGKTKLAQAIAVWLSPRTRLGDPFKAGSLIESERTTYYVRSSDSLAVEFWNSADEQNAIKVVLPRKMIEEWAAYIENNNIPRETGARDIREAVKKGSKFSDQLHSFETHLKAAAFALLAQRKEKTGTTCYEIVPVGADWSGNENILGYADGLDQNRYVTRPALDLIISANKAPNVPHILILDEMNLSHVERYFADVLSAIESEESIQLYRGEARQAGADIIPNLIDLPKNLFIIGTVNIDETTYMFSPKVLDRANVIEFRMTSEDLKAFLTSPCKPNMTDFSGKGSPFAKLFVETASEPSQPFSNALAPVFEAEMLLFFDVLKGHGAEFGYRVAHEAARFISFYGKLGDFDSTDEADFDAAFDCVIVQKFLPKLHGSRAKLGPLLKKLWFLCVSDSHSRGSNPFQAAEASARSSDKNSDPSLAIPETAPYKISAEKIARMWRLLNENGFASFAEA
ncbi:MAG: hypothetical protein Q7T36_11465 [Fluviicoccus sp.]|uniref:McrB family protein n=1 Tax=Fluviicoccus sp. TaxID=2003552 RepID=UPI00271BAFB1|nr:hypothetical protein [Fluviicoccus sp.]MDO8331077.1 hypothetical protein [Fluviicoccus sp.]